MLVWSYLKRLLTQRQCGLQRFARLGHATCIELQFRYALESSGLIFERLEEERGAFKSTVTGDDSAMPSRAKRCKARCAGRDPS